jgi:hypothetical protein
MVDPEAPVSDPQDFFGQQALVRRIFSRIGTERPQSVAVIGGRKAGKTSLLNYLEQVRSRFLEDDSAYLFLHLRADTQLAHDSESFITGIQRLLGPAAVEEQNPYNGLRRTVETLHGQGKKLVFLMDDFHLITSSKSFPLEFFSFLRSLANNYNLAYLTTSFLELQKLCVIKDVEESPFFNIFTNLALGPLGEQAGAALLAAVTGLEDTGAVAAWCGTSPYLLKTVGGVLHAAGAVPPPARFEKTLFPLVCSYFTQVVSLLDPEAFKPLKAIARDKEPAPREAHHLHPLLKQGFLREEEARIACYSPAFALFLKKELTPRMLLGNRKG